MRAFQTRKSYYEKKKKIKKYIPKVESSGVRYTGLFLILTQFLRIYLPELPRQPLGIRKLGQIGQAWLPMKLDGHSWLNQEKSID